MDFLEALGGSKEKKYMYLAAVFVVFMFFGLSSAVLNAPSGEFNASESVSLNWTNSYRQNITLGANATVTLQIHTLQTGILGSYSQRDQYLSSYTSCFNSNSALDNPLTALNATGSVSNTTGTMTQNQTQVFTFLHNVTCPPGRYFGNVTVSDTTNTADQVNVSVTINVPINSNNTLNTTTGLAEFKGTMGASETTYHSYYFNTSAVENATGLTANLTWNSSSKDLDLFLVDDSGVLKAKAIERSQNFDTFSYQFLSSGQVWELRVYGNLTSAENYTGSLYFTTLNVTNTSTQINTLDFGDINVSQVRQQNYTIKNEGVVNGSLVEVKEIYHSDSWTSSGSNNHTFLVPSFVSKVRVSLNWTGGSVYNLSLYNPSESLVGSSFDKNILANTSGVESEEFVETSTITSSPNLWRASVINVSGSDSYTLEARFYVNASQWLASNYLPTFSFGAGENQTYAFNLIISTNATSGLYKGSLSYSNGQSVKVPFQVNVTTPTLVYNNTYNTGTHTVLENVGYNRTGSSVLQVSIPLNNTGNQLMTLTSVSNSTNLTKGSSFMNFVYSLPSTIAADSSDNLLVNITINTSNTADNQGIYSGWIELNGSAAPYEGFNLTLQVNLTDALTGTITHSPSIVADPLTATPITFNMSVLLANGTAVNGLNISNFGPVYITEKNVTTYSQNLTGLTNLTATMCSGGYCVFNATVPANLVGGYYKVTVGFNYTNDGGSLLQGSAVNATTVIINDTGLNLTAQSTSLGSITEGSTTTFNATVTNYGPLTADDVDIVFNKGSCAFSVVVTSSTAANGASIVGSSGSTFTSDIPIGGSVNLLWTLTADSVSLSTSCSDASVTVDQKSFNNITNISMTSADSATSSDSGSGSGSGSSDNEIKRTLLITDSPNKIEITQGENTSFDISVKNVGTIRLNGVNLTVDIDSGIGVEVSDSSNIAVDDTELYSVKFVVPADMKVGEYDGKFTSFWESGSLSTSDTEDFTLTVLPSSESANAMEDYNKIYGKLLDSLKKRKSALNICVLPKNNEFSSMNTTEKLSEVSRLLDESDQTLVLLDSALIDDDYVRAQQHADTIKEKSDSSDSLLKDLESYTSACNALANQNLGNLLLYGSIGSVLLVLVGFFVYNYFPTRQGYSSDYGFAPTRQKKEFFKALTNAVRGFSQTIRRDEKTLARDFKSFEHTLAKDYGEAAGYIRREVGYEFEQISRWVRFKNWLSNTFSRFMPSGGAF